MTIKSINQIKGQVNIKESRNNDYCFVIMSFSGNAILETYYEEAIEPTVKKIGLRCVRVDHEKFTGKISDRIIDGIENCRFVIADLTEDKPNCYFEAGYAIAKDKKVVFQRLDAPKYETVFHFDTKDYNHIIYKTASDLRNKLESVIKVILEEN